MDRKIKVLVIPDDKGGCRAWRMEWPHLKIDKLFGDEFDIVIKDDVDWRNLDYLKDFDIINYHKGIFADREGFLNAINFCKQNNIVTVMDIDDYWNLGQFHPLEKQNKAMHMPEMTIENLKLSDYITTTTEIFAKEISKYNPNVLVFPNAVNTEDPQWAEDFSKKERIRFGFIMGSSHKRDVELLTGTINQLPQNIKDKMQIVLCGYDLRGTMTILGPDGQIQGQRPIKPEESVWVDYEKIVTDNYSTCSPEYTNFLKMYLANSQYPNVDNEFYRREWTKDLNSFGNHYNNIDVLLVPLHTNNFNLYKSELKMVEAGFKHKAIVMSNFGPYTIGSRNMLLKGGQIDPEGNCILVEPGRDHKDWAKIIKKLVENPELITKLADNLHNHVKDTYNLDNVAKKKVDWYKQIVKR